MDRLRRLICAAALALAFAGTAAGQPSSDGAALLGGWDLSLDGTHRRCRVTLAADEAAAGRALRFPAGCRRALPVLNGLGGWAPAGRGERLTLLDSQGAPALHFAREAEGVLVAQTSGGGTYRLERPEGAVQPIRLPPPPPRGVPQPTPVDPARAPPPETLPGLYAVDRYSEREVCRLDLGRALLTGAGRREARLLEGCRDLGLTAFDPVAWRYEGGRLTLTARRGHEVTLVSERDGHWRRDPEVGATLILRKMGPP